MNYNKKKPNSKVLAKGVEQLQNRDHKQSGRNLAKHADKDQVKRMKK